MTLRFRILFLAWILSSFTQQLSAQCVVSDSTFYVLSPANVTTTSFPGMSFLPRTAAGSISKPLYSEGRSSNPSLAASSSTIYSSAPTKSNVFFGGDDGTHGHANTQIIATKVHNLFSGPLTVRGTFYNRSSSPNYNESYLGIAPANYVYYAPLDCDPNSAGTFLGRQGIVMGTNANTLTAYLINHGATDSASRTVKGPTSISLDFTKWYTIEVTFQIINSQLYMTTASLNDGTKTEPLGNMIRIGNALQMGWLDSVVVVTGVDDMATDLVSIKKRCAGCQVEDSAVYDMSFKDVTISKYSKSLTQLATNFDTVKTRLVVENISSNYSFNASSTSAYSSAPYRHTVYFAGDDPSNGYSSACLITKQTYNLLDGEITIYAHMYNRSTGGDYNETWISLLPKNYKYYLSPVHPTSNYREGIRIGGWPTLGFVIDHLDVNTNDNIITGPYGHSAGSNATWYTMRATFDTLNGYFRLKNYEFNKGSGWVKVWANPINIGIVSNFPWLTNFRVSVCGDDLIDSMGIIKMNCVNFPKVPCKITKTSKLFCRNNGQYNLNNSFQVNGKAPIGATYKITAYNGSRSHSNVTDYSLDSGKFIKLNWPGGTWRILITTTCGSTDSVNVTLHDEPIVKAYSKDTQRICSSMKSFPATNLIDSTSTIGGTWIWSGKLVSGKTILINRNSDSIYSYPQSISGYYTSDMGCKDTISVIVIVRNTPQVKFTGLDTQLICENENHSLTVTYSASSNVSWKILSPSDGKLSTNTGLIASYQPGKNDINVGWAKIQTSTILETGDPCPISKDTVIIKYSPRPKPTYIDSHLVCSNRKNIALTTFYDSTSVSGGTWAWTGSIINGKYIQITRNSDSLISYPKIIKGIYTTKFGCKDSIRFAVYVRNIPQVKITNGDTMRSCDGKPIVLNATYSATNKINWSLLPPSDGSLLNSSGSSTKYTPGNKDLNSGNVLLSISSEQTPNDPCPTISDTIILINYPLPIPLILDSARLCGPTRITISSSELAGIPPTALTYQWNLSPGSSQFGQIYTDTFDNNGIYDLSLRITDNRSNCYAEVNKTGAIHIYPKPNAQFNVAPSNIQTVPNTLFKFTNTSKLDISNFPNGKVTSQWTISDRKGFSLNSNTPNPEFQASLDSNTYRILLTVTSDKNCVDTSIQFIRVVNQFHFHAPTAFCPQGLNSSFKIEAANYSSAIIRIYSRWGEKIYESTNLEEGWNGYYQGQPCAEGIYIVIADLRGYDGYHNIYEGTFHLLR